MKRLIATILLPALVAGCGGGNSGNGGTAPHVQLNGSWHATLTSAKSGAVSILSPFFILQNGATLSSDKIVVLTCSNQLTMSGSVSSNNINMVITGNLGDTVTISEIASGNASFSGSYTIKTSGCIDDDMGTLSATLIPSVQSASWTGITQSTRYPPESTTFTANLTEDSSGNITGVLPFTGSSCTFLATESVRGTQTGNQLFLGDEAANGITIFGTVDSVAKNFSGIYSISICNGDNGNVTMSRP